MSTKKAKKATENINDEAPMTIKRAQELMVEFSGTIFWRALQQIINSQDAQVVAVLATVDVFKEPTQAARAQGQRIAYDFIRGTVNSAAKIAQKREENEKIIDESDSAGNYSQW